MRLLLFAGIAMHPQSVLHVSIAVGVPAVYGALVLQRAFEGLEVVLFLLVAICGVVGAIFAMRSITRTRDSQTAVKRYFEVYRSARMGIKHALVTCGLVLGVVLIAHLLAMEQVPWAFGVVEGLRLGLVVLVGLTMWRLRPAVRWIPVLVLGASDVGLFLRLPAIREINPIAIVIGGIVAIYVVLGAQRALDTILGVKPMDL